MDWGEAQGCGWTAFPDQLVPDSWMQSPVSGKARKRPGLIQEGSVENAFVHRWLPMTYEGDRPGF